MTVADVRKDRDALTLTIVVVLDAAPDRAWRLWSDPRQLERWWGPPGYPAAFTEHELVPGARSRYFMTSPDGQRYHGWWEIVAVEPHRRLEFLDGFADETGTPSEDLPTSRMIVTFDTRGGATEMVITNRFPSVQAMEQLLAMGQEQGMVAALGQVEAILADTP